MATIPTELQPAYDRPIDKASVDARMGAQLNWEAQGRATPRTLPQTSEAIAEAVPAKGKPNRRGNHLRRNIALGTVVVAAAGATVFGVERALDQQQQFYQPATPELADPSNR